jgi:hypothetical protein
MVELPADIEVVFIAGRLSGQKATWVRLVQGYLVEREEALLDGSYACPTAPGCTSWCLCKGYGVLRVTGGILRVQIHAWRRWVKRRAERWA